MKRKTAVLAIWLIAVSGSLITGCASEPNAAISSASMSQFTVQYSNPALEQDLNPEGLKVAFVEYWQAYGARDWKRRYSLEKFARPLEEKFYVAYHAKAWTARSILVTAASVTEQAASIDVALTMTDPEKMSDVIQSHRDKWEFADGVWRHVVQDPMLAGFAQ